MSEWKITENRVHGNGQSYNCQNRITAEQLQKTLTDYETITKQSALAEAKLDKVQKQIIRMQMTLSTLNDEVQLLRDEL